MYAVNVIIKSVRRQLCFVVPFLCLVLPPGPAPAAVNKTDSRPPQAQSAMPSDIRDRGVPATPENSDIKNRDKRGAKTQNADRQENGRDSAGRPMTLNVVSILTRDENGDALGHPVSIGYDRDADETYVVSGNGSKVVVYGPNYFPSVSLGRGRGVDAARSVTIGRDGLIYICQGRTGEKPSRITVYNQAFFPVREWTFADMPDAEGFIPTALVIGRDGNIYVAGVNSRGVLVLDPDGAFSHWLRPMDMIFDQTAVVAAKKDGAQEKKLGVEGPPDPEFQLDLMKLPPELRPQTSDQGDSDGIEPALGPVQVNDIKGDSQGDLFLLSEETSKVYVYNPAEELLYSFGEKGGSTGKMSRPRGLAIDEKRKAVFVADYMRHTILIYDMGGRYMYEFGGLGYSPGWFRYPTRLALNGEDQLFVADLFNSRVQVLDVRFKYRFPLFQIPFVLDRSRDIFEPRPVKTSELERYLGPGFEPGQRVDVERKHTGRDGAI